MKVALGSDHGGFELKEILKKFLNERGYKVTDVGTQSTDSCDYPDYGIKVAEKVAKGEADRGILVCGTGLGMSMTANKVKGIRSALCHDVYTAKMAREHNDSNVLALGARVLKKELALDILETWLTTNFEGGRHQKRIDKISAYESK
ncbi:ribose 5-phosphate isomerase B [Candidatus Margulisiibacteriota bacterium]